MRKAGLSLALALPLLLAAGPVAAEPALWSVSDADSAIWLFGSIHMLDKPRDWRTPAFDAALAGSEKVYFEVLMDADAYATMTRLTLVYGMNRDGRQLRDHMTPEQWAEFEATLAEHDLKPDDFQRMRPWLAELTLAQMQISASEVSPSGVVAGVEALISAEVDDAQEFGLETAEEQFELISGRADDDQVTSLLATAAALDSGEGALTELFTAWADGDLDGLHQSMTASVGPVGSPYYRRMISDRNERWAVSVGEMLAENQSAIVIVGAGHLTGPLGLPTLLEGMGFDVERIDGATNAAPPAETATPR